MINTEDTIVEPLARRSSSLLIALVTETFPPEINGVAMTLGRIVDGLLARGHAVQLVRPRQSRSEIPTMTEGWDEVLATGVPIPNYGGLKFGLPCGNRLEKLWQLRRPDIVHVATEGPLGWSAATVARQLNIPVISSFHTNFHSYSSHYGLGIFRLPIEAYLRKFHNRTLKTLAPTRTLANELAAKGFCNVGLLTRGVETQLFNPERRSAVLRGQWGVGDDDLVIAYVGRLAKEKNVPLVVAAWASIRSLVPTAKLLFVGDGPLRQKLMAQCPGAIFAGMRSGVDLAEHYASADVFLFPSLTETFGNVVPEALASGLAVVSFNCAAAAELIHDGVNGRVVKPGDEVSLINAATSVSTDAKLRAQLRLAARQSISQLDWEVVHAGFVRTLSDVVSNHEHRLRIAPQLNVMSS